MCPFGDSSGYCFKNHKSCDLSENTVCKHLEHIVDSLYDVYVNYCSEEMQENIRWCCWNAIIKYCNLPKQMLELMLDSFDNLQNDDERLANLRFGLGCVLMVNLFKNCG